MHWADPATSRDAITATPLENFAWQSGVIAAPRPRPGLEHSVARRARQRQKQLDNARAAYAQKVETHTAAES